MSIDFNLIQAKYLGRFLGIVDCIGDLQDKQLLEALKEIKQEHDAEMALWKEENEQRSRSCV